MTECCVWVGGTGSRNLFLSHTSIYGQRSFSLGCCAEGEGGVGGWICNVTYFSISFAKPTHSKSTKQLANPPTNQQTDIPELLWMPSPVMGHLFYCGLGLSPRSLDNLWRLITPVKVRQQCCIPEHTGITDDQGRSNKSD